MASAIASTLDASQREKWIDLFVRAIVVSFFLMVAYAVCRDLAPLLHNDKVDFLRVASKVLVLAFNILVAWLILIRSQPVAKARGWQPRVSAIMGSNLFYLGMPFIASRTDLPPWLSVASGVLIITGGIATIYSLSYLGRSFSIMAQARRVVTDGPYRLVRHPLYAAEFIGYLGVFIQYASGIAAALLVVQCCFQIFRMFNEEAVLYATFPEYAAYTARTARLIPGLW
jgi:protein-S-isoprenylcysteine O-methyltransferase Ste14